jgi:hypothetical protein
LQNRFALSAPEARKPVAHGETVGLTIKNNQAQAGGGRQFAAKRFFRTVPGLGWLWVDCPRFHRGLLSVAAPQLQYDLKKLLKA